MSTFSTGKAVGDAVREFKVGDRVACAGYLGGNQAAYISVPEDRLVLVPDGVDLEQAAAGPIRGWTRLTC